MTAALSKRSSAARFFKQAPTESRPFRSRIWEAERENSSCSLTAESGLAGSREAVEGPAAIFDVLARRASNSASQEGCMKGQMLAQVKPQRIKKGKIIDLT